MRTKDLNKVFPDRVQRCATNDTQAASKALNKELAMQDRPGIITGHNNIQDP